MNRSTTHQSIPRLTVILVMASILTGCQALEAVGVLRDLNRPPEQALEGVDRQEIRYEGRAEPRLGDRYTVPGERSRAGIVLVAGVTPEGRDDPRLIGFAAALARAGFAVLVPELENLRRLQVSPGDAIPIADAADHLQAELGSHRPVAVVGLSYAFGPTVLAALDQDAKVDLLIGIGPYFDGEATLAYFTTGQFRDPETGEWRRMEPNEYGKWVFVRSNLQRIDDPDDRELLADLADRALERHGAVDEWPENGMGPEARAVIELLRNRDPERVPELVERLPEGIREDIAALNLALRADDLRASGLDFVLVHGRDDRIVPYAESVRLAEVVNAGGDGEARLWLLDDLAHVDIDRPSLGDVWRLVGAMRAVLDLRDRSPAWTDRASLDRNGQTEEVRE